MKIHSMKLALTLLVYLFAPASTAFQPSCCGAATDQTRQQRLATSYSMLSVVLEDESGMRANFIFPNEGGAQWNLLVKLAFGKSFYERVRPRNPRVLPSREVGALSGTLVHSASPIKIRFNDASRSCLSGAILPVSLEARSLDGTRGESLLARLSRHAKKIGNQLWIDAARTENLSCADLAELLRCNVLVSLDDYSAQLVIRLLPDPAESALR
jgi:hypothetical protein